LRPGSETNPIAASLHGQLFSSVATELFAFHFLRDPGISFFSKTMSRLPGSREEKMARGSMKEKAGETPASYMLN
jgi:hypothetical protein